MFYPEVGVLNQNDGHAQPTDGAYADHVPRSVIFLLLLLGLVDLFLFLLPFIW